MPVIQHGAPQSQTLDTARNLQALLMQIAGMNQQRQAQQQAAWTNALSNAGGAIGAGITRRQDIKRQDQLIEGERGFAREQAQDRFAQQTLGFPSYEAASNELETKYNGDFTAFLKGIGKTKAEVQGGIERARQEARFETARRAGYVPYGMRARQQPGQGQQQPQLTDQEVMEWAKQGAPRLHRFVSSYDDALGQVQVNPDIDDRMKQGMAQKLNLAKQGAMTMLRQQARSQMPQVPDYKKRLRSQGFIEWPGGARSYYDGETQYGPKTKFVEAPEASKDSFPTFDFYLKGPVQATGLLGQQIRAKARAGDIAGAKRLHTEAQIKANTAVIGGSLIEYDSENGVQNVASVGQKSVGLSDDELLIKFLEMTKTQVTEGPDFGQDVYHFDKARKMLEDYRNPPVLEVPRTIGSDMDLSAKPDVNKIAEFYGGRPAAEKGAGTGQPAPTPLPEDKSDLRVGALYGPVRLGGKMRIVRWNGKKLVVVQTLGQ